MSPLAGVLASTFILFAPTYSDAAPAPASASLIPPAHRPAKAPSTTDPKGRGSKAAGSKIAEPEGAQPKGAPTGKRSGKLGELQQRWDRMLSGYARRIRERTTLWPLVLSLLIALLYGVVHAAGPGHAKSLILAFFLFRPEPIKRGLLFGSLVGFVHAGASVVYILVVVKALQAATDQSFHDFARMLRRGVFVMLILMGTLVVTHGIFSLFTKTPSIQERLRSLAERVSGKTLVGMAMMVGLVPCTATTIVLLLSLSLDLLWLGLMLVTSMAVGMSLTISGFAIVATIIRRRGGKLMQRLKGKAKDDEAAAASPADAPVPQRRLPIRQGIQITVGCVLISAGTVMFLVV